MNDEIWMPVFNYEGLYEVSNIGRIKRVLSNRCLIERILKHNKQRGYHVVKLCKETVKKPISVHRLVAQAFIPNPENKPYVNHLDSNKSNNSASNLEWCTQKENVKHAFSEGYRSPFKGEDNPNAKLSQAQALSVEFLYSFLGFDQHSIAIEYGISQQLVSRIVLKKA
jgi:NUMOD4 motif/HNH endonuclease